MKRKTKQTATAGKSTSKSAFLDALAAADGHHDPSGHFGTDSKVNFLSTGILSVDLALGGGWAQGRMGVSVGEEGSGKTLLGYMTMLSALSQGTPVVAYDHEGTLDQDYMQKLADEHFPAVNVEACRRSRLFTIKTFDTGDQSFAHMQQILHDYKGPPIMFFVDSYAAMNTEEVQKASLADKNHGQGSHARMFSESLRTVKAPIRRAGCYYLATNQTRTKLGVFFGNPTTQTGGNAVLFYSDQRVMTSVYSPDDTEAMGATKVDDVQGQPGVREGASLRSGKAGTGRERFRSHKGTVVKNKVMPPFRSFRFRVVIDDRGRGGLGVDKLTDTLNYLIATQQAERLKGNVIALKVAGSAGETLNGSYPISKFAAFCYGDNRRKYVGGVYTIDKDAFDLRSYCFEQLRSGEAFDMYAEGSEVAASVVSGEVVSVVKGTTTLVNGKKQKTPAETVVAVVIRTDDGDEIEVATPSMTPSDSEAWLNPEDGEWSPVGSFVELPVGEYGYSVDAYPHLERSEAEEKPAKKAKAVASQKKPAKSEVTGPSKGLSSKFMAAAKALKGGG